MKNLIGLTLVANLIGLGFLGLAALMMIHKVPGHGWAMFCAILTAVSYNYNYKNNEPNSK